MIGRENLKSLTAIGAHSEG